MRHRAHRSVLDRLRPLARTRTALATAALLLAGLATGTALTAGGPAEKATTAGPAAPTGTGTSSDEPTPTITGSPGPDESPLASGSTIPPTGPTIRPAETPVPRSSEAGSSEPTPRVTPSPDVPDATATEAPTTEQPAQETPETTATTRSTNASRWVIGIGSDTEATYECSLDGGAYQPCGSTVTYDGLGKGTHSFAARATDGEGDTDPSPATLSAEIGPRGQG